MIEPVSREQQMQEVRNAILGDFIEHNQDTESLLTVNVSP